MIYTDRICEGFSEVRFTNFTILNVTPSVRQLANMSYAERRLIYMFFFFFKVSFFTANSSQLVNIFTANASTLGNMS